MLYRKKRTTVPSSRFGGYLELIEATGWTWQQVTAQPADLVDEMLVKIGARNRIQAEEAAKAEAKAKRKR